MQSANTFLERGQDNDCLNLQKSGKLQGKRSKYNVLHMHTKAEEQNICNERDDLQV